MPRFPLPALLLAGLMPAAPVASQAIQRCEAADGRVSYSNAECPPGTRPVRAVAPAAQPTPEAQRQAQERVQREQEVAQAIAARRQAGPAMTGQAYVPADEARRAIDCAYLRAELDSNRRLRNVLTTRRYYSTEDVEQMDAQNAALAADYRRFCSR
jgi:hypothetical protein